MQASHDLSGVMKFAERDEVWRARLAEVMDAHFQPAMDEFALDFADLEDLLGNRAAWTVWGCAFEDFLTRRWDPEGQSVVDVYLKRRGWSEKVLTRAYIEGLKDSRISLYEVSQILPGQSMVLRDLLTGAEPVTVREKSATRSLKPWDKIAARIVPVRDHHVIAGGVLPFSNEAVDLLHLALRDGLGLRKRQKILLTPETLSAFAPVFSHAWLFTHLPAVLDPQLPQMSNSDGDDLVFHDLRVPFSRGTLQKQIAVRLSGLPDLVQDGAKVWTWIKTKKSGAKSPRPGITVESHLQGGTVLGTLEIRGKTLTLSVNSAERAVRAAEMIRRAAGDLLQEPMTSIQTVEQALADQEPDGSNAPDDLPTEIALQITRDYMDRHYRETLDQPIPMLGNNTPRQAVPHCGGAQEGHRVAQGAGKWNRSPGGNADGRL
jgi:hypothetical protein